MVKIKVGSHYHHSCRYVIGAEILELLTETNEKFGRTVVMVTHDPKAAAKAKTVVHFEKGKLELGNNNVI